MENKEIARYRNNSKYNRNISERGKSKPSTRRYIIIVYFLGLLPEIHVYSLVADIRGFPCYHYITKCSAPRNACITRDVTSK